MADLTMAEKAALALAIHNRLDVLDKMIEQLSTDRRPRYMHAMSTSDLITILQNQITTLNGLVTKLGLPEVK